MNLTSQAIINPKSKYVNIDLFQPIPSSSNRTRLNENRSILNRFKPFETMSFKLNKISFNMISCPKGFFTMGANDEPNNLKRTESIRQPFLLGETEVTQELYQAVMKYNPSHFGGNKCAKNPVDHVSWFDAVMFCNKLSQALGRSPYYQISNITLKKHSLNIESADVRTNRNTNGFRLPTEKEWEYAAKAGTDNLWSGCNDENDLKDFAWFDEKPKKTTHPVRTRKPNEWGFYDMSGNVDEWCSDKYTSNSTRYVVRGGGWANSVSNVRSTSRSSQSPDRRYYDLGFRIALNR